MKRTSFDPTGKQFGKLTILAWDAGKTEGDSHPRVRCKCACGNQKIIRFSHIKAGKIVSCGCHKDANTSKRRRVFFDLKGDYGLWTAIRELPQEGAIRYIECKCQCGKKSKVLLSGLRHGLSRSCGCNREHISRDKATTHGLSKTSEYRIWLGMLKRCRGRSKCSPRYHGRGISVCKEWERFEIFYRDMGPRPSVNHSVDRIDNDGNYEPKNCRWATQEVQCNNKRNNRWNTYRGADYTLIQLSKISTVSYATLMARLNRGWSVERAVNEPKHT